jgi:hypothetical protein
VTLWAALLFGLYGLAVYLFRDQIWPKKYIAKADGFQIVKQT